MERMVGVRSGVGGLLRRISAEEGEEPRMKTPGWPGSDGAVDGRAFPPETALLPGDARSGFRSGRAPVASGAGCVVASRRKYTGVLPCCCCGDCVCAR
jgi:hypothetical protein